MALAFLETLEREELLAHVQRLGRYFRARLEELQQRYAWIRAVRGAGLMLGLELAFPGKAVVREALARGVIFNCTHDTVLRFLPPYIIQTRHVDQVIQTLEAIFARLDARHRSAKRP